jgi:DNA-binding PadR family transcriptional regulator
MKEDLGSFLPLSPAILYILLSLAEQDRHGYGIMQEVDRLSEGGYKLGPGTLYDNLEKLLQNALVKEIPRPAADDDRRRRYYRLSDLGRLVLGAEACRLKSLFRKLKPRLRSAEGV